MLAGAAVSLILLTTLGGTTYPWASAPIILLGVIGTVLLVGFVLVERRAAEPVLPLRLFRRDGFLTTNGPNSNGPSGLIVLTDAGRQDRDQLVTARRDGLAELLDGWAPEQHAELAALLSRLARGLLANDPGDQMLTGAARQ